MSAAKQTLAKARPKIAAMRELAKAAAPATKPAKADSAKESVKSALNKHIKQIKSTFAQYPDQAQNLSKDATEMFKKAEKAGALEKAAEFLKRKEKLDAEMVKQDKSGNRNEWYGGLSDEDKNLVSVSVTGVLLMAMRKVEESNALREHLKKKEDHKANLLRKVIASENAKAPAAKPAQSQTYKKSYSDAKAHLDENFRDLQPGTEAFNDSYAEAQEKLKKWQRVLKKNPSDETSQRQVGWYQGLVDTYKDRMKK